MIVKRRTFEAMQKEITTLKEENAKQYERFKEAQGLWEISLFELEKEMKGFRRSFETSDRVVHRLKNL